MGAERMKQMADATILFNLVFEQEMETQVNEHRTEQEILFLCHSVHPRIRIVGVYTIVDGFFLSGKASVIQD